MQWQMTLKVYIRFIDIIIISIIVSFGVTIDVKNDLALYQRAS